mmetsp:Transcript_71185/g.201714  ORF Transcript_71185/g.201714 Transcript_71185/m.201714 type:complete len:329 (+) Transcript_71185:75-1061(+)
MLHMTRWAMAPQVRAALLIAMLAGARAQELHGKAARLAPPTKPLDPKRAAPSARAGGGAADQANDLMLAVGTMVDGLLGAIVGDTVEGKQPAGHKEGGPEKTSPVAAEVQGGVPGKKSPVAAEVAEGPLDEGVPKKTVTSEDPPPAGSLKEAWNLGISGTVLATFGLLCSGYLLWRVNGDKEDTTGIKEVKHKLTQESREQDQDDKRNHETDKTLENKIEDNQDDIKDMVNKFEDRIRKLEEQIQANEGDILKDQKDEQKIEATVDSNKDTMEGLRKEINELKDKVEALETQIKDTHEDIQDVEKDVQDNQHALQNVENEGHDGHVNS